MKPKIRNIQPFLRLLILLSFIFSAPSFAKEINILDLGAKPDSLTLNTSIIQRAVDQCAENGGGRVIIPSGKFVTGTIYLKSNVELHFQPGALLLGSTDPTDFPMNFIELRDREANALIFALGQENISVTGRGIINGRGDHEVWQRGDNARGRPKMIYFIDCTNVLVRDITLTNSAFWVQDYLGCNYVRIDGIRVYSYGNHNNDGLDIDSKNVVVTNCIIDTDDDALCFKSHIPDQPCENITVTNCVLASNCNAIKFGTASIGGFKNISVSNCTIRRPVEDEIRQWHKRIEGIDSGHTVISGLALEAVDGGVMDQINISNITMDGVQTPIFIKLGDRKRQQDQKPGQLKNVRISNIVARNASLLSNSITGFPGHYVENVAISNVSIQYKGGGTLEHHQYEVPENEAGYPENRMFGHYLPAYGFYIRHVRNLSLQDIRLSLASEDKRSVIRLEDVEDVRIDGFTADLPSSDVPVVEVIQGKDVWVSGSYGWKEHPLFIDVDKSSSNVKLAENELKVFQRVRSDQK